MESLNFNNIKLEKANAILRYKKCQRLATLFRFIEFCIFFFIISGFSTSILSTEYFKGLSVTLISPRFVFLLGNAIVIILFLNSEHSPAIVDSMDGEASCEQSKKQSKQSILIEEAYCEQIKKQRKQSILTERRVEKRIHRSHSDNAINLSHDEEKPRKKMIRSATVGCLKVINTDNVKPTTTSYPEDKMSSDEFRKTVEAFIARQQRLLREEELFSAVVST